LISETKVPKSLHRIPPRGHDPLALSYKVHFNTITTHGSSLSFLYFTQYIWKYSMRTEQIFGVVAGEGMIFLWFNKFVSISAFRKG